MKYQVGQVVSFYSDVAGTKSTGKILSVNEVRKQYAINGGDAAVNGGNRLVKERFITGVVLTVDEKIAKLEADIKEIAYAVNVLIGMHQQAREMPVKEFASKQKGGQATQKEIENLIKTMMG